MRLSLPRHCAAELLLLAAAPAFADLKEIKARGEPCYLGIRYANFVTSAGKGFAVVAAEVGKLAERSQVAVQEIGQLAGR